MLPFYSVAVPPFMNERENEINETGNSSDIKKHRNSDSTLKLRER